MKTLSGIKAVALINPTNNDTVVLNRIGSESTYTPEITQTETTDGVVYGGGSHTLDITFYDADSAKLSQLREWQSLDTPLIAVAYGLQGNLIWNEPTAMQSLVALTPNAREGASAHSFTMVTFVPNGIVKKGVNVCKAVMWRDNSGSYPVPQLTGANASNYGANFASVLTSATLAFPFPFEGARLSAGFTTSGIISSASLIVKNAAGTTLSTQAFTGSPRSTASVVVPAGGFTVELVTNVSGAGGVNNISIRVDGSTDFTTA